MLAVQAEGCAVTTFEGISAPGAMHPLQESFWTHHGLQCGFCTPGMVLTALELLADDPAPSRETVRERISGNLCRCTGYQSIVDSIMAVADPTDGPSGDGPQDR
jgi:carbon-monoxide dehydrogenase small subunit